MKTLILLLLLSSCAPAIAQNMVGERYNFIQSELSKTNSELEYKITTDNTPYIQISEQNFTRAYYFNKDNLCFKYMIIFYTFEDYISFIKNLNELYIKKNDFWFNETCAIHRSIKSDENETVYIFEFEIY